MPHHSPKRAESMPTSIGEGNMWLPQNARSLPQSETAGLIDGSTTGAAYNRRMRSKADLEANRPAHDRAAHTAGPSPCSTRVRVGGTDWRRVALVAEHQVNGCRSRRQLRGRPLL